MAEHLICRSEDLVEGGKGVRFTTGRQVGAGGTAFDVVAFVVRFQGKPYAYLNRCGHVPVELDWQHGDFFDFSGQYLICATHGALYGPESGRCISGRCAGKGLAAVVVSEHDGAIYWQDGK
ncbi:MAG: Rieske 2Fe-2S domain-containing protein [Rhodocyclaceae bacterium]|nr:Rieske 2Fe-2S domain-containing protein [Rhodocyclaceae bacterium]MBK6905750.1 Rieske 2Fe-2S domain-containing protein [Rhodocyclaceae bacterium]